jgi:protein-S-isoprenylcysteine O-methyltransferase Ste14
MQVLGVSGVGGIGLQISAVWIGGAEGLRIVIGLALLVLSLMLFWWAVWATRRSRLPVAFDRLQSPAIVASGPYALMRHPFYTAYSFAWLGGALGGGEWWAWIAPAGLIPVYFGMALSEERELRNLPAPRGPDYERYQSRTGMILPRIWPRSIEQAFSEESPSGV